MQPYQNLGQSCDSLKRCFEPQQRREFASSRQAINESDKSEASRPVVYREVEEVDVDVHTLGEQVKLARDIRVKREKLAEGMRDLESRRRDAHLSLRTSLAEIDADIKEHVRLSGTSFRFCQGHSQFLHHSRAPKKPIKCTPSTSQAPRWRACQLAVKVAED